MSHPLKDAIDSGVTWCRENDAPVPKYTAVVKITGNTRQDIENALWSLANSWPVDYHERDSIDSTDGTTSVRMEHTNPAQTPEEYDEHLKGWSARRRAARADGRATT